MSSVLARNRSLSDLEFYRNGCELRKNLTRFVMNDKNVPKRYKFVFAMPMIDLLLKLFNNIVMANSIYPVNEHEMEIRRDCQTKAIGNCEQIIQLLQYLIETLPVDANKLVGITESIKKEIALLKNWRKTNKVFSQNK